MCKVSNFFWVIALITITSCSKGPEVINLPDSPKATVTFEEKTATLVVKPTLTTIIGKYTKAHNPNSFGGNQDGISTNFSGI